MISKEQYKAMRNKRTFLYEYFLSSGGSRIPEPQFAILFGVWLARKGSDHQSLIRKIVGFLDKKFGYK